MDSGRYYIGTDLKFQITLTAEGFDQNRDRYDVDFHLGNDTLHFTQDDIVVGTDGNHYLFIPTSNLNPGVMRLVITAYIPDSDAPEHVRKEVESVSLGPLKPAV